jgi:hypothetical protein
LWLITINMLSIRLLVIFIWFMAIITTYGCGVYSFSGTAIDPRVKTIAVADFQLLAANAPPILLPTFTEKLKNKFTSEARLDLKKVKSDVEVSGAIISYLIEPAASGANDQAQLNRLTLSVRAEFNNRITKEEWNQTFKASENFDRNASLSDVETALIEVLTQKVIDDIYNKAFTNW